MHPDKLRENHYDYYIDYLRNHFRYADILRIDHVMGLHRLFWIPDKMEAKQGVYVKYPAEELYAILNLESHWHKTVIVGEDLGTVPVQVRHTMNKNGLHRMYVVQYELMSDFEKGISSVPDNVVASLNTHDMPTFTAFWRSLDIKDRVKLGLMNDEEALIERKARHKLKKYLIELLSKKNLIEVGNADAGSAINACLAFLGLSKARGVLVNLEDLWQEIRPQNVPSTGEERPNWRRKARYKFEVFSKMPEVVNALQKMNRNRGEKGTYNGRKIVQ
jgi:4-alpha-glucanotransferase